MSFVSRHRFPLIVGLILLVVAVSGIVLWRRPDPPIGVPLMIMPAFDASTPSPASSPSPSPAPSLSPSVSKSPLAGRRPPAPSPSRSRSASPAPRAAITARLSVTGGFSRSVRGVAVVVNEGAATGGWSLVITIPGVRMTRGGSTSGSTVTFTGTSLAPDDSVRVTFRGYVSSRDVGPVTCKIGGRACEITTRGIPE